MHKQINFKQLIVKNMHTKWLVIILIVGVCLMSVPGFFSHPQKPESPTTALPTTSFNTTGYEQALEARLSAILATLNGVSDVDVMITLEDSGEDYYAKNEKNNRQSGNDSTSNQTDDSLALKSDPGGGQSPVLLKSAPPKIGGVFITAKGVEAPETKANIINAIRAVFNVPLHRVQVLEKA